MTTLEKVLVWRVTSTWKKTELSTVVCPAATLKQAGIQETVLSGTYTIQSYDNFSPSSYM
jgi:hypothetical protein